MRILIIGGTKFIGPYVVRSLHKKGHEVILFNRGKSHYPFLIPVTTIKGDRAELSSFSNELLSLSPDVIIDMIPYSELDTKQLADIFHRSIKRIVIVSSCDVYRAYDRLWKVFTDQIIPMPLNEKSELRQNLYPYRKLLDTKRNDWKYDYEKILVEKTIRSYSDINSTILRLPIVYGPGDHRVNPYLKLMDDNQPILIDEHKANWRFTRGYVEDIAHAIVLSALDERSGKFIYNVGEIKAYSELEWINQIAKIACYYNEIIKVPFDELPSALQEPLLDFDQDLILDTNLIRKELKYEELSTHEQAMRNTVEWSQRHK